MQRRAIALTRALLVFALLLCSSFAFSCTCSYGFISDETLRAAKNIIIFQLVSARVIEDDDGSGVFEDAEAEIRIVKRLRGTANPTGFRYTTNWCCGIRLEVGNYYAAVLDDAQATSYFGNAGNLLLFGFRWEARTESLQKVLIGQKSFEQAFGQFDSDIRNPPPPPPPPCPKVEAATELESKN